MKKIKIIAIITALAAAFANTAAYANETWQGWPVPLDSKELLVGSMVENFNYFYPPKENGIYISDDWELPIDYTKYDEYSMSFDKELRAVTDYYGDGGDVVIPSEIDGVPVERIYGGGKFNIPRFYTDDYRVNLENFGAFACTVYPDRYKYPLNVTIPDTVTSIESCAFAACDLNSINIPDSVKHIGADAFSSTSLNKIHLPSELEVVSAGMLSYSDIHYIRIPDSVKIIDGVRFVYSTKYFNAQIPMIGLSYYYEGAFTACRQLQDVLIGSGTESIGYKAFAECSSLTNILIPESVTEIDDTAFDNIEQAFTIYTTEGSYADTFAQEKGFNVRYYDKETKDNEGYDLLDIAVESGGEDEAAKSFTLTCNIRNNFVMEDTPVGTLVTAFYDENGCMVDAVIDDEYLNGLADTSWLDVSQYSRTINTDKNVSYAKAFIWEDSQSMVPLDEAVSSEAA